MKPYSAACDRNKEPILEVLREFITSEDKKLLEVGSGTGQHAVFLAPHFKHLEWYTSDVPDNHAGIKEWLGEAKVPNIKGPFTFEVGKDDFPKNEFDIVFTANTFHIMSWKECKTLMKSLGQRLTEGAQVFIYGPFKYQGEYTSQSNAEFDESLKTRNPLSGIRAFEDVVNAMTKNGFSLTKDVEMPANNRILIFMRIDYIK